MRRETQIELVRRVLDAHAQGTTQLEPQILRCPVSDYVDPGHFERERRTLFREGPVVACTSASLREPGDYVSVESGGVPLLVVRGDDGAVRAFHNVCRHRASLLADGCGHVARSFSCRFHGWTYGLDGSLVGRPFAGDGFAGAACADLGLRPVPVSEAHGLVVVRPIGDDPVDVGALLGTFVDDLDDLDMSGYHVFDRWTSSWPCNWKLLLDTFLESYHVFALHRTTVARFFVGQPTTHDVSGRTIRFQTTQRTLLDLADRPEEEWDLLAHATVEYLVAPNTILSHSVDHVAVYRFVPTAVDATDVELVLCTPRVAESDADRNHYGRTMGLHRKVATDEDFDEQVRIQRSLDSGTVDATIFGRNEGAAIRFHLLLDELLGGLPTS